VEVLSSYPPELPPAVRGDAGRLRQILLNLAGNAVKFTTSGEVVIRAERGDDPSRYAFSVSDTGIGIEPADLSRLFEPFTQADATSSRRFGGTGLGLTISRQLVDLMGGTLSAASRLGHGSRFSFTVALPAAPVPEEPHASTGQLAGRRLLIVDGNETGRDHLARHARSWGMDADTAADSQGGLDRLRDAAARAVPYHLVVVDQNLTDMAGTSLTERILDDPGIPDPTVILLTSAYTALPAAGGIDVLLKPVGPSTLHNRILHILDPGLCPHGGVGARPVAGGRGKVLVAEDNEINQMVAVDTLAVLGYQTDVAVNGLEALELASAGPYRLILMDCQMPKLDGYEATREFRRRERPEHRTPVIAMTAGALAEDRQRCLDAGMDDYLAKPIDPDELRATLQRWTRPDPGGCR
jgi:CheY-like chemotaxis protein